MIVIDEKELKKLGVAPKLVKEIQKAEVIPLPSIKSAAVDNTKATQALVEVINKLVNNVNKNKSNSPDLTPIVKAIYNIQETQLNVLQLLEQKITPQKNNSFEFLVARNKQGFIHKITAKEINK